MSLRHQKIIVKINFLQMTFCLCFHGNESLSDNVFKMFGTNSTFTVKLAVA